MLMHCTGGDGIMAMKSEEIFKKSENKKIIIIFLNNVCIWLLMNK